MLHKNFLRSCKRNRKGASWCRLPFDGKRWASVNSILIEGDKNWDNKWLPKLRTDIERENAVFGVLLVMHCHQPSHQHLMMVILDMRFS